MPPDRARFLAVLAAVGLAHGILVSRLGADNPPIAEAAVPVAAEVALYDLAGLALMQPPTAPVPVQAAVPDPPPPDPAPLEPQPTDDLAALAARLLASAPVGDLRAEPTPLGDPAPAVAAPPPPPPAAASSTAAVDCPVTEGLRVALDSDPEVRQALARVPRAARSVANAIMVWDGQWIAADVLGGAGAAPLRRAIAARLAVEPAACRGQTVRGPRFISLSTADGTTVLALGSGQWRWSDLLTGESGATTTQ